MTTTLLVITKIFFMFLGFYCVRNAYRAAERKKSCWTMIWCTMILVCAMGIM